MGRDSKIKICKVCGKEYEGCAPAYIEVNVNRWQDVACCPEHGEEYFRRVIESRMPKPADEKKDKVATSAKKDRVDKKVDNSAKDVPTDSEK